MALLIDSRLNYEGAFKSMLIDSRMVGRVAGFWRSVSVPGDRSIIMMVAASGGVAGGVVDGVSVASQVV